MRKISMPVYGRQHIKNDDKSKLVRLWDLEAQPGTLLDQLKNAYLAGFTAVDERDAYRAQEIKLDRLKPEALTKAIKDHSINATAKIKRARNVVEKLATGWQSSRLRRSCRRPINQKPPAGCGTGFGGRSSASQKVRARSRNPLPRREEPCRCRRDPGNAEGVGGHLCECL